MFPTPPSTRTTPRYSPSRRVSCTMSAAVRSVRGQVVPQTPPVATRGNWGPEERQGRGLAARPARCATPAGFLPSISAAARQYTSDNPGEGVRVPRGHRADTG